PRKILDYSLDSGMTWRSIGSITNDSLRHSWNLPDTFSSKAVVRVTDTNNLTGRSGIFTISKLMVLRPARADSVQRGALNYQITWTGAGTASNKTLSLSLDSGLTWTSIGSVRSDALSYSWNVPDTASRKAMIRIVDTNGLTGLSGLFTIYTAKSIASAIVVIRPAMGDSIVRGTQNYQIT